MGKEIFVDLDFYSLYEVGIENESSCHNAGCNIQSGASGIAYLLLL